MGELVNLRRARKQKARAEKEEAAEINRTLHGTPKHLRKLADAKNTKAARDAAAHRLDKDEID